MTRYDLFFTVFILVVIILLVVPLTHAAFFGFAESYVYVGGFLKFFLFASLGDVLSRRIRYGDYRVVGLFFKAIVWGIIGIFIVVVFEVFPAGVLQLQSEGLLPFEGVSVWHALFTSVLMNVFFAPTMMMFHRITDQYIELHHENERTTLKETLRTIDYPSFFGMLGKTIPLFWIPAHTITFLLPGMYRAFFAALLGVMLGLFLNLFKRRI